MYYLCYQNHTQFNCDVYISLLLALTYNNKSFIDVGIDCINISDNGIPSPIDI